MAKTINFEYGGRKYTLEYTRKTISDMERRGFVASDIDTKPMLLLPSLFEGAFLAHHKNENRKVIEDIFSKLTNKDELIAKLVEMYNEPLLAYIEEPTENEGNLTWTAS